MCQSVKEIEAARQFSKELGGEDLPSEYAIDVLLAEVNELRVALRRYAIGPVSGHLRGYLHCYLCQSRWKDARHEHHASGCLLGNDR